VPGQSSPLPPQLQSQGSPSTAVTGGTQTTSGCAGRSTGGTMSSGADMPSSTPGITGNTTTGGTPRITTDATVGTNQSAQNSTGSAAASGGVTGC
jgi:hypothetical protein